MTIRNISDVSFRGLSYKNNNASTDSKVKNGSLLNNTLSKDTCSLSNFSWVNKQSEIFKKAGNECIKTNNYAKAINLYQKAIINNPDYSDAYFNLAKTFKNLGDYDKAILNYEKYLAIDPLDAEVMSNLGECYKDIKQYDKAEKILKKSVAIDPKLDFASRQLKEIAYLKQYDVDPVLAEKKRTKDATENMRNSLILLQKFYPPEVINKLDDILFCFDDTDSLSGHQNIAQYENSKRRIVVTNKYVWAAPEVVTSYLVHEVIHSLDRDALTSIKEEQDAYRKSVEFWDQYGNGIKDPEMDYALALEKKNPIELDNKVEEIYSTRGDSIPMTSPNHGLAAKELTQKGFNGFIESVSANIKNFFLDLFVPKKEPVPAVTETGLYASSRR